MIYINERKCIKAFYHWHLKLLNDGFGSGLISNGGLWCFLCANLITRTMFIRYVALQKMIWLAEHYMLTSGNLAFAEENTGNVCCFSSVMHLYENRVVEKVACTNKALLGCFKTLAFPANTSACTLLIESVYLMPRNMSRSRRYCKKSNDFYALWRIVVY